MALIASTGDIILIAFTIFFIYYNFLLWSCVLCTKYCFLWHFMWSLFIYQNWIRKLPLSHIPVPMYSSILSITLLVILSIKYSCSPTVLFNQSSQLDYYYHIVQISREFDRKGKRLCRQLTSFAQSYSRNHELLKKSGASKSQLSMVGGWDTPHH